MGRACQFEWRGVFGRCCGGLQALGGRDGVEDGVGRLVRGRVKDRSCASPGKRNVSRYYRRNKGGLRVCRGFKLRWKRRVERDGDGVRVEQYEARSSDDLEARYGSGTFRGGGSFTSGTTEPGNNCGSASGTEKHLQLPIKEMQVVRRSGMHPVGVSCCNTGLKSRNVFKPCSPAKCPGPFVRAATCRPRPSTEPRNHHLAPR